MKKEIKDVEAYLKTSSDEKKENMFRGGKKLKIL
jgi:hypothetical protein